MQLDPNQVLQNAATIFWNTHRINENPEARARLDGLLETHADLVGQPKWASEVDMIMLNATNP